MKKIVTSKLVTPLHRARAVIARRSDSRFTIQLFTILALAFTFHVSRFTCNAATTTNLLDLTSVNGTNAGKTVSAAGLTLPRRNLVFRHSGITNVYGGSWTTNGVTNSITRYWQASLDAANWVNILTNVPTSTNASIERVEAILPPQTIYYRVITVTTNPLTSGVDLEIP